MGFKDRLAKANAAARAVHEEGKAERVEDRERLRERAAEQRETYDQNMAEVRAQGAANRAEVARQNAERMERVRADREGRRLGGFGWKRKGE